MGHEKKLINPFLLELIFLYDNFNLKIFLMLAFKFVRLADLRGCTRTYVL